MSVLGLRTWLRLGWVVTMFAACDVTPAERVATACSVICTCEEAPLPALQDRCVAKCTGDLGGPGISDACAACISDHADRCASLGSTSASLPLTTAGCGCDHATWLLRKDRHDREDVDPGHLPSRRCICRCPADPGPGPRAAARSAGGAARAAAAGSAAAPTAAARSRTAAKAAVAGSRTVAPGGALIGIGLGYQLHVSADTEHHQRPVPAPHGPHVRAAGRVREDLAQRRPRPVGRRWRRRPASGPWFAFRWSGTTVSTSSSSARSISIT